MRRKIKARETGAIIGRHQSWRGSMNSVAVTMSAAEWNALTRSFAVLWEEVEEDFDVSELTLDQRIALLVIGQADRWREQIEPECFDDDLDDGVPF